MKIENKSVQLININTDKKVNIEKGTSFESVLEETIKNEKVDSSKSVTNMEKLLEIDIKNNKDKYVKENGKINILDIINQYGGKIGSRELHKFSAIVTGLYKEGLIDEKDYFQSLKWIALKIKQKSTDTEIEREKKNEILNLV